MSRWPPQVPNCWAARSSSANWQYALTSVYLPPHDNFNYSMHTWSGGFFHLFTERPYGQQCTSLVSINEEIYSLTSQVYYYKYHSSSANYSHSLGYCPRRSSSPVYTNTNVQFLLQYTFVNYWSNYNSPPSDDKISEMQLVLLLRLVPEIYIPCTHTVQLLHNAIHM
jgi:hypothetical protein